MPRPKAVIIVGLGEEGKLRAAELGQSVRQAVIAWAQRLAETNKQGAPTFELAATLLGSGGTGVGAGDAARLVALGVYEANALLKGDHGDDRRWPCVSHLHFIELYLDRAAEAWRSLRMQAAATPGRYAIDDAVMPGTGSLLRPPDSGYRGAEFDFITVETTQEKDGTPTISYTLDTRRARSEVRGQRAQSRLLSELVATASNDQNRDQQIGRTLFNLLIPVELEAYLAGSGEMQIELDPQTAKIPWELLDTKSESDSDPPWAIRVKLLRKLRIKEFRERVTDAGADASALVIGEPECHIPRLLGARSGPPPCAPSDGGRSAGRGRVTALTATIRLRSDRTHGRSSTPCSKSHGACAHLRPWDAWRNRCRGVKASNGTSSARTDRQPAHGPRARVRELCHLGSADAISC